MGRKCSVPGCRSNYNDEDHYTTVFKFPSDPVRKNKWLRNIHRENFEPNSTSSVCEKHFEERFIIRSDSITKDDGTLLVVPRQRKALTTDAEPTIFHGQPSYLSKTLPTKRKTPTEREGELMQRDEQNFENWCLLDKIKSYDDFKSKYQSKLADNWLSLQRDKFVLFYIINDEICPKIIVSFKVFEDLSIKLFHEGQSLSLKSFEWLFGKKKKLEKWTIFENLIRLLLTYKPSESTPKDCKISLALELIENYCKSEGCEAKLEKLQFIQEQLSLISNKKYSASFLMWCAKVFFTYPAAYKFIQEGKTLTLPHPSYLRRLASPFSSLNSADGTYMAYLKKKVSLLKENERVVSLLLDEIYINSSITYKAGQIFGACSDGKEATTIQAFMTCSLLSKNKDIVALIPVRNLKAEQLLIHTTTVLKKLHECAFTVVSVISDNNRINRNMFTSMCGGELKCFIDNPYSKDHKLFFLFDSVHLIKAIRNNWLNTHLTSQSFFYPSPDNQCVSFANLNCLKKIYENEKNDIIKLAPKLSQKVLFPTSLERQNVKYALNLFHETNLAALEQSNEKDAKDTQIFIDFILKWWKIVNTKHPRKGLHLKEEFCLPIESMNDSCVEFLQSFCKWLDEWEKLAKLKPEEKRVLQIPTRGGTLSRETFFALKFTTQSMVELTAYLLHDLKFNYVILGKFQTDCLEARFGQYRQMCGGTYNVSFLQVIESERKLRILDMLSIISQEEGKFEIKNLCLFEETDTEMQIDVPEKFYDTFNTFDLPLITDSIMSVIIFISGYVASSVCKKLSCENCVRTLIKENILDVDCPKEHVFSQYIKLINRGGLKWPQELLVSCIIDTYHIFQNLVCEKFESSFLLYQRQKELLVTLALEKIDLNGAPLSDKCDCGNNVEFLVRKCISCVSNIFLNNYSKIRNDKKNSKNFRRKMDTLV